MKNGEIIVVFFEIVPQWEILTFFGQNSITFDFNEIFFKKCRLLVCLSYMSFGDWNLSSWGWWRGRDAFRLLSEFLKN
jgi:hypothetical protein